MRKPKDEFINDEAELPELSPDFAKNVKKHFEDRDARDSLLVKRLGEYGADLAIRILERYPHLTTEQVIEMVENMS